MRTQQAKLSFRAGVLTPRLSLRADVDQYASGLRKAINFIISPQGGGIFRQGYEFIESTNENRKSQFKRGGNESDIIIEVLPTSTYGNGDIHFHGDATVSIASLTDVHSYASNELDDLYFTNQEDTAVIVHRNHPPLYLELLDGVFTAAELPADLVPNADYKDSKSPQASITISNGYSLDFVNGAESTWNPSRNWILRYDGVYATGGQGNPKEYEFSSTASILADRVADALSTINALSEVAISVLAGAAGTDFTLIDVTMVGPGAGLLLELLPANSDADRHVDVTPTIDETAVLEGAWSFPTYVFHSPNYYQCIAPNTAATPDNEPPNPDYWVDLGTTAPDTWVYQYPTGNDWTAGITYSPGGRGWPSVAVIHQQRMILMANPGFTMGIFASRISQYKDFERGPEDDDPFFFALDTTDTPTIKWAESQQHLVIGTSSGDFNLTAEVTLTPSDIQILKQNSARSEHSRPVTINTSIFYIEQGKEKIRATSWVRDLQARSSRDISLIAENLLHAKIKRLALLQTPEVMMVALREDGALTVASMSEQEPVWYEFDSHGFIQDITSYYSTVTNQDELWVTISYSYVDGGPNQFNLERMPYPSRTFTPYTDPQGKPLTEQGVIFLDSWVRGTAINNVITGLDHLNGETVAALVDDAWTGEYVVSNGSITLDDDNISGSEPYNGISAVGLLYKGTIETLEESAGNQRGTGFGSKRRWNKLYVRTLDSALPIINGHLPPDRTPSTEMDIAETVRMGLQDIEMRGVGWGDGSILIEQDRPYPTQVIGCFGEFSSNNA